MVLQYLRKKQRLSFHVFFLIEPRNKAGIKEAHLNINLKQKFLSFPQAVLQYSSYKKHSKNLNSPKIKLTGHQKWFGNWSGGFCIAASS